MSTSTSSFVVVPPHDLQLSLSSERRGCTNGVSWLPLSSVNVWPAETPTGIRITVFAFPDQRPTSSVTARSRGKSPAARTHCHAVPTPTIRRVSSFGNGGGGDFGVASPPSSVSCQSSLKPSRHWKISEVPASPPVAAAKLYSRSTIRGV